MGGQIITDTIGSAENVQNVNPFTSTYQNQLQSMLSGPQGFLGGMQQYSPENALGFLQGAAPGISGISGMFTDPYQQSGSSLASILSQQAMNNVSNQFSNAGALNSGAALSALARGAAEPWAQFGTNLAQMQSGLSGNLVNQLLSGFGQGYGTQAGLAGQAMGILGQQAAPEWWQPTYMQHEVNPWQDFMGGIGAAASTAAGVLSLLI